jgi:two-component system sensor histidine kinase VicK
MIPIWIYLSSRIENKYYEDFRERIEKGFERWSLKNIDDPSEGEMVKAMSDSEDIFLVKLDDNRSYTITNKNAVIVYTNDPQLLELLENGSSVVNALLASDNFIKAMSGSVGNQQILETYGGESYFDYAVPIGNNIIYFKYNKEDWAGLISDFNSIIITSIIIGLAVSFVIGYMLSRTITSPIVKLMHKAQGIAAGDFDEVIEVKSNDEIGKLTDSFNYMASSLKNTLAEISSEKGKLETILNYMTDGIIAFDLNGDVIHTNPASSRLLGFNKQLNSFHEYCEKYGFKYSLEDVIYLQSQQTSEMSIELGEKTIKVYFAVFTDENKKPEGVIAVLQDITEQKRLENMRNEFVANVSHELRTPLTSIKSYSETLLDGALEDRETAERFVSVINNEADRMTRLVKDLLQLSRLDNRQMNWNFSKISLVDLIRNSVEKMELEARSRKQTLESYVLCDIPMIEADYGRIEQVVFNLIGNAIKYTPEGGKITVYIGKIYNDVYFKVADNGIGIPTNDLPRIFERFYRVDKARSREMGGTGLGLAIAKEIVEAHSGVISINSQLGMGTEVTVQLPVKHVS